MADILKEIPVVFYSQNKQLVGIYHQSNVATNQAVVIVVGGPQTRVGSHRQFVLLAREYAKNGIDVLRFDYSGAGDSEGSITEFTQLNDDIAAAINTLQQKNNKLSHITLWGLCDAASAILLYLAKTQDARITQIVLLNPWVRQPSTEAKVYLRSYYIKRLFQLSFWKKIFKGRLQFRQSAHDIKSFKQQSKQETAKGFVETMLTGAVNFSGDISFLLSGNDLTAEEFKLLVKSDLRWQALLNQSRNTMHTVSDANHTFSSQIWHQKMLEHSLKAVKNFVD